MMEARKVQKVGYSTLIVSLPKDWVEEVGLKQGDIVTFRRESDGGITVYPGLTKERENFRYIIDADLCDSPNLLTRIITANYLTGHDTIQIVSKKELSSRHLEEVRGVSRRLTGLGIVEQSLKSVTLQSFVDPTKFPIYGLMRRLQIILSSMLEQAVKSVVEGRVALADEVLHMEEEADRIYWMIIRQLLLAVLDRRVAKEVGIEGPMHVVGNRVIAKSLERMADSASHVALESDLEQAVKSVVEGRVALADEVLHMEEEADRIYWMIIRQLLLAVLDRRVAKEVGIEGPMHVVGNRVIAKSLERMADSASHVALESQKLKGNGKGVDAKITKGLLELSDKVRSLIED